MIKDYAIFYNFKSFPDILIIQIDKDKVVTKQTVSNDIVALYNQDKLIGYNILNLSKYLKIKSSGQIFLPNNIFIDVINNILKNNKFEILDYKTESKYIIGKIIDINEKLIKVDLKDKIAHCLNVDFHLKIGDIILVAYDGAFLPNGDKFNSYLFENVLIDSKIILESELDNIDKKEPIILNDSSLIGKDFFRG